jgi:hypothetical protein
MMMTVGKWEKFDIVVSLKSFYSGMHLTFRCVALLVLVVLQCYYVHNNMTLLCSPFFNTIFSSHCNVMCSSQCDFTMFGRFQCYYVQHIAKFGIFCHITTLQ